MPHSYSVYNGYPLDEQKDGAVVVLFSGGQHRFADRHAAEQWVDAYRDGSQWAVNLAVDSRKTRRLRRLYA